jgi:membrane-associated protein
MSFLVDLFLHLDQHMAAVITQFGAWTYALLFLVIFMETGFVVTPFLPGDSLLFAAGALAALGSLNIGLLLILMMIAAWTGNTVNYWIGRSLGERAYQVKWVRKEYLDRTHAFFKKHGGQTIFLARFVPIIRTFAPFVAGVGEMPYGYFSVYNILGCVVWVALFTLSGYFFGNIPFIRDHFSTVVIAIILVSLAPAAFEAWKVRQAQKQAAANMPAEE